MEKQAQHPVQSAKILNRRFGTLAGHHSGRGALITSTFAFIALSLSACGSNSGFAPVDALNGTAAKSANGAGTNMVAVVTTPTTSSSSTTPAPSTGPAAFQVCSKIPFSSSLAWPSMLGLTDREAFKLALNISGSFEGNTGWSNLTNNFDGEGLSMGLLNQTLGTGSLQPLLVKMRSSYPKTFASLLTPSHLSSMYTMLDNWTGVKSAAVMAEMTQSKALRAPASDQPLALSPMDYEASAPSLMMQKTTTVSGDAGSVAWAVANLYNSSGGFVSDWSKDLTALTTSPSYVSIQLAAAAANHLSALSLEKQVGCKDLRCYLLMYDFVVQNGGLYSSDISDFKNYVAANPNNSVTANLKQLVELRLRHVRSQYVNDVRSRKDSIINGHGAVHGDNRNFETEYCFNRLMRYPQ